MVEDQRRNSISIVHVGRLPLADSGPQVGSSGRRLTTNVSFQLPNTGTPRVNPRPNGDVSVLHFVGFQTSRVRTRPRAVPRFGRVSIAPPSEILGNVNLSLPAIVRSQSARCKNENVCESSPKKNTANVCEKYNRIGDGIAFAGIVRFVLRGTRPRERGQVEPSQPSSKSLSKFERNVIF